MRAPWPLPPREARACARAAAASFDGPLRPEERGAMLAGSPAAGPGATWETGETAETAGEAARENTTEGDAADGEGDADASTIRNKRAAAAACRQARGRDSNTVPSGAT